jgi:hypothetical protein
MLTFLQANQLKCPWTHNNTSHSYTHVWGIGIEEEDMMDGILGSWMVRLVERWWSGAASFGNMVFRIGLELRRRI